MGRTYKEPACHLCQEECHCVKCNMQRAAPDLLAACIEAKKVLDETQHYPWKLLSQAVAKANGRDG